MAKKIGTWKGWALVTRLMSLRKLNVRLSCLKDAPEQRRRTADWASYDSQRPRIAKTALQYHLRVDCTLKMLAEGGGSWPSDVLIAQLAEVTTVRISSCDSLREVIALRSHEQHRAAPENFLTRSCQCSNVGLSLWQLQSSLGRLGSIQLAVARVQMPPRYRPGSHQDLCMPRSVGSSQVPWGTQLELPPSPRSTRPPVPRWLCG